MTAPVQLAAARLLRLAVSLRAGVSPDKADADAIIAAVERWHLECCSLDQAFDVKLAAGQLHPGTRAVMEQSRCHLRAAAAALAVPRPREASSAFFPYPAAAGSDNREESLRQGCLGHSERGSGGAKMASRLLITARVPG